MCDIGIVSIKFSSNNFTIFFCLYCRIEGGELFERVIDDDFILTEKSCTVFMRQICEGVAFIHKQRILHLDMKVCKRVFFLIFLITHTV